MGRYYDGDIEGKFWFGVQASDDADFFGVTGTQPEYIEYYFDEGNLEDIRAGIKTCEDTLAKNKERLDKFFEGRNSYNDDMIKDVWKADYNIDLDDLSINVMLQYYARLELGNKILKCVLDKGECSFNAEV